MPWEVRPPPGRPPSRHTPPPPQGKADHLQVRQTPLPGQETAGYGQQAGGTHSTGMHTCLSVFISPFT